jgi:hypothetical protein
MRGLGCNEGLIGTGSIEHKKVLPLFFEYLHGDMAPAWSESPDRLDGLVAKLIDIFAT